MNVLVVGSGGREHALCWKLSQSPLLSQLYCAPGNPGTAQLAENVDLAVDDISGLVEFADSNQIDLTIVGPEYPLTLGLVDALAERGLSAFGPRQAAAMLEGSKEFAKRVMIDAGVPTAGYQAFDFSAAVIETVRSYCHKLGFPVVLKADGLAAGKGVFVCHDDAELDSALEALLTKIKADKLVVENFLSGVEASYIVATNGTQVVPFVASHDHKRLCDGQQGPNTGGMGAVSPTSHLTAEQERWVLERVMYPVVNQMRVAGNPFVGFLYAGLMISESGEINVLEFNVRFGDPECQAVLPRLESDLLPLLVALSSGKGVSDTELSLDWSDDTSVCVVLTADGYPDNPRKGDQIDGIEQAQHFGDVKLFHAGTKCDAEDRIVTNGGRVLSIVARDVDSFAARERAYRAADMIQFRGRHMRRDIAA